MNDSPITDIYKEIAKMIIGLERGLNTLIENTPAMVMQKIDEKARMKLNSTYKEYMDSVDMYFEDNLALVIEIDEDNFIANAVEDGIDGWDMKETHLKSSKAKISKDGYRYLVIPMEKEKDKNVNPGTKSFEYQQAINTALENPTWGNSKTNISSDGTVMSMSRLQTNNPMLKGFYKKENFKNIKDFQENKNSNTRFVMFRIMSENPKQKDKWIHPGIKGVKIFDEIENWFEVEYEGIVEQVLTNSVNSVNITDEELYDILRSL